MKTLELDSLTPPPTFSEDLAEVAQAVCGSTAGVARDSVRPYHEVAALLCLTGVEPDVLSPQQVKDIETRALRRLKRDPRIRGLFRDAFGRTPALA